MNPPVSLDYGLATMEDGPALLAMLRQMHEEIGIATFDTRKVGAHLVFALQEQLVLIARDGERIVGSMGMVRGSLWYSEDECLDEKWCYVVPEYRGNLSIFDDLMYGAKSIADQEGVMLLMGVSTLQNTEAANRIYSRHGKLFGSKFIYQPEAKAEATKEAA